MHQGLFFHQVQLKIQSFYDFDYFRIELVLMRLKIF